MEKSVDKIIKEKLREFVKKQIEDFGIKTTGLKLQINKLIDDRS